jgi:hypothetical protein
LVIVKSPLSALLTCCQTSELSFSSEIAWVVPVVSVSVNEQGARSWPGAARKERRSRRPAL